MRHETVSRINLMNNFELYNYEVNVAFNTSASRLLASNHGNRLENFYIIY